MAHHRSAKPSKHVPFGAPPWAKHKRKRKRQGLRHRLTFMFAFVALAAVSLTSWLTLGAVFETQQELFSDEFTTRVSPSHQASGSTLSDDLSQMRQENGRIPASNPAETRHWRGPPFGFGNEGDWDDNDRWSNKNHWQPWGYPSWDGDVPVPVRQAAREITQTAFRAAGLSFALASIVAALVTRVLTRPLKALTDGANRFEAGERGLRLNLPRNRDELRTLTEAFNKLVSGFERQEVAQRNLVADIAHDLRTPLAVMRSELEGMQDGVVERDDAGLTRLHGEVMLLSRLVDDLRTLSLAEGGGLSLKRESTLVQPLLEQCVSAFQTRITEAGMTLTLTEVDPALIAFIDPFRITQVLNNLLDNAIRYAAPTAVEVGAQANAGQVEIWVRDYGSGLSPDSLGRAFERFYRGDASRTRLDGQGEKTGSGLGLAIAKALVEANGGSLDARNHPEGGAVFTLTLDVG
ncbi:MAG: ATP-binding protein [Deinococcota bacterium]